MPDREFTYRFNAEQNIIEMYRQMEEAGENMARGTVSDLELLVRELDRVRQSAGNVKEGLSTTEAKIQAIGEAIKRYAAESTNLYRQNSAGQYIDPWGKFAKTSDVEAALSRIAPKFGALMVSQRMLADAERDYAENHEVLAAHQARETAITREIERLHGLAAAQAELNRYQGIASQAEMEQRAENEQVQILERGVQAREAIRQRELQQLAQFARDYDARVNQMQVAQFHQDMAANIRSQTASTAIDPRVAGVGADPDISRTVRVADLAHSLEAAAQAGQRTDASILRLVTRYQELVAQTRRYEDELQRLQARQNQAEGVISASGSGQHSNAEILAAAQTVNEITPRMAQLRTALDRMTPAFAQFGVNVRAANGELRPANQVVAEMILRLREMAPGLERDAEGVKLFGASWRTVIGEMEKAEAAASKASAASGRVAAAAKQTGDALAKTGEEAKKSQGHMSDFFERAAAQATGFVIYRVLDAAAQAVSNFTSELIKAPAEMEKFLTTYTITLGSLDAARQRMGDITDFAIKTPQTRQQIIEMDQLLSVYQVSAERYGRTTKQLWQDIADASSTRPGLDPSRLAEIINVAAEGDTGMAMRRLRELGLASRKELSQLGVEFNANTGEILSDSDTFLKALLTLWENKFGGLSEAQSHTFSGIMSNMQDFGAKAMEVLGRDLFANARVGLDELFTKLNTPETMKTLADWGDSLARITYSAGQAFGAIASGAGTVLSVLRPVVDLFHDLVKDLPKGASEIEDPYAHLASIAGDLNQKTEIQKKTQADVGEMIAVNQRRLEATKDAATETARYYDRMLDPLREQVQLLDRAYESQNKEHELAKLNRQIYRDTALSRDIYSSEGRAAALRLVDEKERRDALIREQQHTKEKNALEDGIHVLEKRKSAAAQAYQDEETALERLIKRLEESKQKTKDLGNATADTMSEGDAARKQLAAYQGYLKDMTEDQREAWRQAQADAIKSAQGTDDGVSGPMGHMHGLVGEFQQAWADLKAFWDKDVMDSITDLSYGLDDIAKSLGYDGGVSEMLIDAKYGFLDLAEAFGTEIPIMADAFGTFMSAIGTGSRVLIDTAALWSDQIKSMFVTDPKEKEALTKQWAQDTADYDRDRAALSSDFQAGLNSIRTKIEAGRGSMASRRAQLATERDAELAKYQNSPHYRSRDVETSGSFGDSDGFAPDIHDTRPLPSTPPDITPGARGSHQIPAPRSKKQLAPDAANVYGAPTERMTEEGLANLASSANGAGGGEITGVIEIKGLCQDCQKEYIHDWVHLNRKYVSDEIGAYIRATRR